MTAPVDDIAIWTRAHELYEAHARAAHALSEISGVGSGPFGFTPDQIKESAAFRECRRACDLAFEAMRAFNRAHLRALKRRPRFWRPET